jgi:3-hydroxymyristoyl/3-hydroxydecanoyl-(acyl carrier protein) dehydratase
MMAEENILHLIPQRPPFVMVGRLLHADENGTRTSFRIKEENIFVEKGRFREAGLMENIAQTAAAGAGYLSRLENKPVQVGYIGAVKNLEVSGLPETGDELVTEIKVESRIFNVAVVSGIVRCNEKILAKCEMKIFISQVGGTPVPGPEGLPVSS